MRSGTNNMWLDLVDRISESKGGGNTMTEMKHGGGNHHEAANYNLGEHAVGGSLYERKRYSKSAKSYRRGGALKKFQDEGQVNTEEAVVPTEVPVTPVVANTNTEIPVVPLEEEKGEGYGGRQLYNGPLKDLNVHHFVQFANEDGSPNLSFRPEWTMGYNDDGSAILDPEVMNWRSEKRGLSVDEILQWYMFTQLQIPPEAHTVADYSDYSYWGDKNYGKIRQPAIDDNGNIKMDINGSPMWDEFNEEKHNEYLEKAKSDPNYAWYPTSNSDAFAMARDLGLKTYFYDGQPKLAFLPSEIEQMEEKQIEADKVAQAKWFDYHSTNPSEQATAWLGSKGEGEFDRMNLSDISNETMVYMQLNHPEMMEYIDPNFENKEDALAFLERQRGNSFGGDVTVAGKKFLLNESYNERNLAGTHFDFNQSEAMLTMDNEWQNISTLNNSQKLHNMTAEVGGDLSQFRSSKSGFINSQSYGSPVNMEYQDGVDWLNQFDPNGRMYNWKTSYTGSGDKYVEFLPMIDGNQKGAKEKWQSTYDFSDYKTDFREVTKDNMEEVMDHMDLMGDGRFHSYLSGHGGGVPGVKQGSGAYSYSFAPDHRKGNDGDIWKNSRSVTGPRNAEMTSLWGDAFMLYAGGKTFSWAGGKLFNWGTNRVIGGGASALKTIWTGARSPIGQQTFKNGAWQFTKNTAATAFQPVKFASDTYAKSWINRWVMSPAIPGTYGVASGNTAANVYFGTESYKAAKQDFSEGDYAMGTLNATFTAMNAFAPYARYKNFNLIPDAITAPNTPLGVTVKGGGLGAYVPFKNPTAMGKLFGEAQKLPSSRMRNLYPNIFGPPKLTQKSFITELNNATNKYVDINKKSSLENMLLKYSPK